MSLREKFEKAHQDGAALNKAADLAAIDKRLKDFVTKLPNRLERVIAARAAGKEQETEVKTAVTCKHLGPHEFSKEDLETLNGFRALVDLCKSPDYDVQCYVMVESSTTPIEGTNTRNVNYEAQICISADPARPFADSALVLDGCTYNGYKSKRYDAAAIAGAPAPAPLPLPEVAAGEKIAVLSPLKLSLRKN